MTAVIRLAQPADAALVQTISAAAFIPAYQPIIGAVQRPAEEDYTTHRPRQRVAAGGPGRSRRGAGHRPTPLRLYTNDRMSRNLALYRSCGFIESGRRPHPTRAGIMLVDLAKRV